MVSGSNKLVFGTVFGAELVATLVSPVVLNLFEKHCPTKMSLLKETVDKNIVTPNINGFSKIASPAIKAHENHLIKEHDKQVARGDKSPTELPKPLSEDEKSKQISDKLVKGGVAFTSDFLITWAVQALFNKVANAGINSTFKTTAVEVVTHIGFTGAMTTIGANFAEWLRNSLSNILKKAGFTDETCKNTALSFVNVGVPGFASAALAGMYAKHNSTAR